MYGVTLGPLNVVKPYWFLAEAVIALKEGQLKEAVMLLRNHVKACLLTDREVCNESTESGTSHLSDL